MTDVYVITASNFPTIFAAFEMISHDGGRQAGHQNYAVPLEYEKNLPVIDHALRMLTEVELNVLCIGEQSEAAAIVDRYGLRTSDELLQRFSEEFC